MENKEVKEVIVISGINLFIGGSLTILHECLCYLEHAENIYKQFFIIALVHRKEEFDRYKNIHFVEFSKSRKSWFIRMYYEYFHFKKLSKKLNIFLWFSLHDITPNVVSKRRAVYCHNPSPFIRLNKKVVQFDKGFLMFNLFYKNLYAINIKKNDHIVVQQQWLREKFVKMFQLNSKNIIVAYPEVTIEAPAKINVTNIDKVKFFYPAVARVFKNFEVLLAAVPIIKSKTNVPFEIILTAGAAKNKYEKHIKKEAANLTEIVFLGWQPREVLESLFQTCSCLIFPSKLETWGLPITEAKLNHLPMLIADLPYAKETVGDYETVSFFNPDDAQTLAYLMTDFLEKRIAFAGNKGIKPQQPFSENWAQTFSFLLQ